MAPLHRTLSNRLLSKLPPFHPSWPRAARFSAASDGGAPAPAPSSAAAAPWPPYESSPPIDAGLSIRKPISLWPGMYFSPVINALWEARSKIFEEVSDTGASGKGRRRRRANWSRAARPGAGRAFSTSSRAIMCSGSSTGILGTRSGWGSWWKISMLSPGPFAIRTSACCIKPFSFGPALLQRRWHHKASITSNCFCRQDGSQKANSY